MDLKSFIKNSSLVVLATVLAGIFSFALHPLVARYLTKADFADFQSLMALSVILTVPSLTFGLIITRYTAKFMSQQNLGQIKYLETYFFKRIFLGGIAILILFLGCAPLVVSYLKLTSIYPVFWADGIMFMIIIGGVFAPILQGMQKFTTFGVVQIIQGFLRFLFGVLGAILLMSIYGPLIGIFIAMAIKPLIGYFILERFFRKHPVKDQHRQFYIKDYKYYLSTFFIVLFLTGFYNLDVVIAKNIFDKDAAALYSAMAVLAKAIFFAATALENVMFPVVIEKHSKNDHFLEFFLKSLSVLVAGLIFSVFVFYEFGYYFVKLMGDKYLEGVEYLWKIAIFISLFALVNYLGKFLLAVRKTRIAFILGFGAILQIFCGYLCNDNLHAFINGMSYSMGVVLVILILYIIFDHYLTVTRNGE